METRLKSLFRWRCALSGRRDALPTAMASLDADQLGRMDELRGCPAKETQMDRKYSEGRVLPHTAILPRRAELLQV